jgi:hypothetical protein
MPKKNPKPQQQLTRTPPLPVDGPADAEPSIFSLETGQQLIRPDGSYFQVVATATIHGAPHVILQAHNRDGSRAPHPKDANFNAGHAPVPLATCEEAWNKGDFTIGHAPK